MKVLIACEESQTVCNAFRKRGHEAYSCDIIECSDGHNEWHIMQDVIPLLNGKAVKSLKKIALCGFVLSLFVEVIQLVSYRGTFDLDDLLHNTTGTVIGCILYIVLLNKFQKIYDFIKASANSVFHNYKA